MKPIGAGLNICVILIIWISLIRGLHCLVLSLSMPPVALTGDSITLSCSYNLQGEPLYMIKWYKGQSEFFRVTPKELPHKQVFPLPGVHVNVTQSNAHQVTLTSVDKATRGKFRVEVTTDAPNFYTALVAAHLEVIEPPSGEVTLSVDDTQYSLGDMLRARCTSPMSSPPMNITWRIQDQEIHESHPSIHYISQHLIEETPYPLFTTESHLSYQVSQFRHGKFTLVCEARLYDVVRREASQEILEKTPRVSPVRQLTEDGTSNAEKYCGSYGLSSLLPLLILISQAVRH